MVGLLVQLCRECDPADDVVIHTSDGNRYPRATREYIYSSPNWPVIVVEGDKVVGLMILAMKDLKTISVRDLIVKKDHRRQGVGRKLLEHAEKLAKRLNGRVKLHAMQPAVPFYKRCGYRITRKYEYGCGMLKNIPKRSV